MGKDKGQKIGVNTALCTRGWQKIIHHLEDRSMQSLAVWYTWLNTFINSQSPEHA